MSGQVLFHPSYLCQIGESDQGRFVKFGLISRVERTAGARTHMWKIFPPHFCKSITNVAMSLITGS